MAKEDPPWNDSTMVMSYNIAAPRKPDLDVIAAEIRSSNADIVGLQEVDRFTLRNFKDMAAQLAKMTSMHVVYESARWTIGGTFGNAILSRWPITHHEVVRFTHVNDIPDQDGVCVSKVREQRIGLVATLQVEANKKIRFATTHFGHCILEQKAAAKALGANLDTKTPVILVGDFNAKLMAKDGSASELGRIFTEQGFQDAQTNPSQKLPLGLKQRIDWILHSPCWKAESFAQGEPTASDHGPVTARLTLLPSCGGA